MRGNLPPRILTIAGSDSGGGAGIQADIKTITALGGFAMSAVTALTAQNTVTVRGVHEVPPQFVALQIDTVVEDIGVDAVKTGMLGSAPVVEVVAGRIKRHRMSRLVVDPVMVAKSGARLLKRDAEEALRRKLLPLALVVTPNMEEAAALCGMKVGGLKDMREAARRLLDLGPKWALVKGGHLKGRPTDVLFDGKDFIEVARARVRTRNTHGTGCTFASAIATYLGMGKDVPQAVCMARDALERALRGALPLGKGHGPLDHRAMFKAARSRVRPARRRRR